MMPAHFTQSRWSLNDLIASPAGPDMEDVFTELEAAVSTLEAQRSLLSDTISEALFSELLAIVERVGYFARLLNGYAALWFSEDNSHQDALAFRTRVEKTLAAMQNRTLFFDLWWKSLDKPYATRLTETSGDIHYYLESLRRYAPYTLSEPVEKAITTKDINGAHGLVTVYDMITNGLLFEWEVDGKIKHLTRSELMAHAFSPSPEHRARAYQTLYREYAKQSPVLGQIYRYVVGDWYQENVGLRGMADPISVRNLANDVPDDVVRTLLEVCRKNAPLFQRYFELKAAWLGRDKLRRYDLYAPLATEERIYPFEEAVPLITDALHRFSPRIAGLAERVLAERHLDSETRPGKDTGAFCYGVVPDKTPWVSVNYTGLYGSVSTLAHELGHAIHSMLASGHSTLTFRSSLPLAETASVFSEILLLERVLADESNLEVRRAILAQFIDETYATAIRQAYFVLFERDAHDLINTAGATSDKLATLYMENLNEQFGESMELSDEFRWEWTSIPHIYATPFYCYAYTFGQLLVLSLYQRYQEEKAAFVPRYERILESGGSRSPIEILDEAGIDIRPASFWQGGFDIIANMIRQLEDLTAEVERQG
ncbi:M3 family oligoendopeptidase [Candidatus Bipolaricaulota bacterium]|nr:M3 family oligoendopeptidase [Candidatus Bipolaricaulota bacterium]